MFYVSLMVSTKQKTTPDKQIIKRKESKLSIIENHQITKENNRGRKEQRLYKTTRKQQNSRSKSLPINNKFECKWIKFSN